MNENSAGGRIVPPSESGTIDAGIVERQQREALERQRQEEDMWRRQKAIARQASIDDRKRAEQQRAARAQRRQAAQKPQKAKTKQNAAKTNSSDDFSGRFAFLGFTIAAGFTATRITSFEEQWMAVLVAGLVAAIFLGKFYKPVLALSALAGMGWIALQFAG